METRDLVDTIKDFFNKINVDVPFYILGGSVFSILNTEEAVFDDIDVFFYNETDLNKVLDAISNTDSDEIPIYYTTHDTKNALSVSDVTTKSYFGSVNDKFSSLISKLSHNPEAAGKKKQFIKLRHGPIKEVFQKIDFSCSRCCVTSDYELVKDKQFSNHIKILTDNIVSTHLDRFQKYVNMKNAIDEDHKELKKLLSYFIHRYDETFPKDYGDDNPIDVYGKEIVIGFLKRYAVDLSVEQHIHNTFYERVEDEYERVEIFKKFEWSGRVSLSDEALVAGIVNKYENPKDSIFDHIEKYSPSVLYYHHTNYPSSEDLKKYQEEKEREIQERERLMEKYAEFFL